MGLTPAGFLTLARDTRRAASTSETRTIAEEQQIIAVDPTYEYGETGTATTSTWFLFLKSRHRPLWYPLTSRSQTWRH